MSQGENESTERLISAVVYFVFGDCFVKDTVIRELGYLVCGDICLVISTLVVSALQLCRTSKKHLVLVLKLFFCKVAHWASKLGVLSAPRKFY